MKNAYLSFVMALVATSMLPSCSAQDHATPASSFLRPIPPHKSRNQRMSGAKHCRTWPVSCCEKKERSALLAVIIGITTTRGTTSAPVADKTCSIQTTNLSPAQDGRASSSPLKDQQCWRRKTTVGACAGSKSPALVAAVTWAMSSKMVRVQPGCATASILPHSSSKQTRHRRRESVMTDRGLTAKKKAPKGAFFFGSLRPIQRLSFNSESQSECCARRSALATSCLAHWALATDVCGHAGLCGR